MSAVYGSKAGFSISQISLFVSVIYVAALVAQYPIGWLSDRIDRRILIVLTMFVGGLGAMLGYFGQDSFTLILIAAALVGGTSNPLYALLLAYANDYLEKEDMAAASGGLLMINGCGAIVGPIVVGWLLESQGAEGFWLFMAVLSFAISGYAAYRMTRRSRADLDLEAVTYAPVSAATTPVIAEIAQEVYIETEEEEL
jgi:MFS family permease